MNDPPALGRTAGLAVRRALSGILLVAFLAAGILAPRGSGAPADPAATPEQLLTTWEGHALRVGPHGAEHFVGLLANGEGAVGIVVAADGAFLAFTCGIAARADAWFSGDWYRGELAADGPVEAHGPDGEILRLTIPPDGRLAGELVGPSRDPLPIATAAAAAAAEDWLFPRDDADGILGAVALPGNTVCAVKRTGDGRFVPAGTTPY